MSLSSIGTSKCTAAQPTNTNEKYLAESQYDLKTHANTQFSFLYKIPSGLLKRNCDNF